MVFLYYRGPIDHQTPKVGICTKTSPTLVVRDGTRGRCTTSPARRRAVNARVDLCIIGLCMRPPTVDDRVKPTCRDPAPQAVARPVSCWQARSQPRFGFRDGDAREIAMIRPHKISGSGPMGSGIGRPVP